MESPLPSNAQVTRLLILLVSHTIQPKNNYANQSINIEVKVLIRRPSFKGIENNQQIVADSFSIINNNVE